MLTLPNLIECALCDNYVLCITMRGKEAMETKQCPYEEHNKSKDATKEPKRRDPIVHIRKNI